jgi:enamine deaminase RidA (YjgF/YER057c/UK114 family)
MEAMTSAEPTQGDKIETTAQVDVDHDGTPEEVKGEAWFHVHNADKKLEWGSPGPNRYSGQLAVLGDGTVSTVSVSISTEHEEEGLDIEEGLKGTLANIKRLVEAGLAGCPTSGGPTSPSRPGPLAGPRPGHLQGGVQQRLRPVRPG